MEKKLTIGQLIFSVFYVLIFPVLLFFISGDWLWVEGWIFAVWFVLTSFIIMTYLYFKDPALLAERFRRQGTGNQPKWDKYLSTAMMIIFFAWMIVMPLDSRRFTWSTNFPVSFKLIGIIFLFISTFFLFRSFKDNTFLSPLVRIQAERKQQLVTTGVYGIVRHPMYLGALLMFAGAPLLLGSYLALALGLAIAILLALRAIGEEKMLMKEFKEYADYKRKVKYRFIPFVW